MKKKFSILFFIIGTWLFLLFIYNYGSEANDFGILIPTVMSAVALINSYLINYIFIPKFYFPNKHLKFIFSIISILVISTYIQILFVFSIFVYTKFDIQSITPRILDIIIIISTAWLVTLASISIIQTSNASERAKKQEELTKEKYQIELQLLKSQINPHFLFNTLNSIYVLANKKSDKTADIVIKLSQTLDFLLYKSSLSQIEIIKEIEFINDYIELEKLRYGEKLNISLSVNLSNPQRKIEPMLFIPLVENAFKHGVRHERKKANIEIKISDKTGIEFNMINSKPIYKSEQKKGGIGLSNVRNRLEKLYENNYIFLTENNKSNFKTNLKIELPNEC